MNNVSKSIGWADFTWNIVTGCKRNPPCEYCYARRIHERFNKTPFSEIQYHPERLLDKMPKKPSRIFVGSMSDCEYWTKEAWKDILLVCENNPKHTFMFLSKNIASYNDLKFPDNCMQGITITGNDWSRDVHNTTFLFSLPHPFISIEPLMGGDLQGMPIFDAELVIVGAMTGPGATPPKPEWAQSIKDNVPAEKIYWKNNIRKYL